MARDAERKATRIEISVGHKIEPVAPSEGQEPGEQVRYVLTTIVHNLGEQTEWILNANLLSGRTAKFVFGDPTGPPATGPLELPPRSSRGLPTDISLRLAGQLSAGFVAIVRLGSRVVVESAVDHLEPKFLEMLSPPRGKSAGQSVPHTRDETG